LPTPAFRVPFRNFRQLRLGLALRMRGVAQYGGAVLGLGSIAVLWIGVLYSLSVERDQALQAATQNTSNLARVFEENTIRSLKAVDQTLLSVRDAYEKDPKGFDATAWARNTQFLNDFTFQLGFIDKNGLLTGSNLSEAGKRVDLSDREHFQFQRDNPGDALFISKPVLGRASGKWSIQMTRKKTAPDGSFDGVVVVSLDPQYLSQFYESVDLGTEGVVMMTGTDGTVRARASMHDTHIGHSLVGARLLNEFARADSGAFEAVSRVDGILRIYAYRGVRGYPLIVVVGIAEAEILAHYYANRLSYIALASVLTVLLLIVTVIIMRHHAGLKDAKEAAETADRAKSEFLATMSHELRTPLNAILGFSEVMADEVFGPIGNERYRGYAQDIQSSGRHLLDIINDVLDLSKAAAGKLQLQESRINAGDVVRSACRLMQPRVGEASLRLKITLPPGDLVIDADERLLKQMLLNLLSNACKFTLPGGRLECAVTVAEDGLAFSVSDTGIGIPAEHLDRVLQPFVQVDSSLSRRREGTGLGLALVKAMAELHGGKLRLESEPGIGTTATVILPLTRLVAAPGEMAATQGEPPKRAATELIG
jgi:signal transduction histidine kinase